MLWKYCTQYASKFGKLSSGHRTGKGQFSFQSQRKAMSKNAQTTAQLHSSHTLATHSSVLAWRIPGTAEPDGLPSMRSHRVGHDWSDLAAVAAHTSKVMLKILQARLQQYVNQELQDIQAVFRKGRGTRDQIANISWISKKQESSKKHLLLLYWLWQSLWLCGSQQTVKNSSRDGDTIVPGLPPEKSVCRSRSNS